ncbi:MAG: hypothetical protein QOJ43_2247 [Gaiellaceae bacterium]|jgi:hypothetical protein|nr:hypothetical protein [Gaiellaceae bacterium]
MMRTIVLGSLGLVLAVAVGLGVHLITRATISLPVVRLDPAAEQLAPPAAATTAKRTTTQETETAATTTGGGDTGIATNDDSGKGRGRGRSGDDSGGNSGKGGGDD